MSEEGIIKVSFYRGEGVLARFDSLESLETLFRMLLKLKSQQAQITAIKVNFNE